MLEASLAAACVLLLVSGTAVIVLWRQRAVLWRDLEEADRQNELTRVELGDLRTQIEVTREKQRVAEDRVRALGVELDSARSYTEALRSENGSLQTSLAVHAEQQASLEQRRVAMEQVIANSREEFKNAFEALAAATLDRASQQMVDRAKAVFEAEQKQIDAKLTLGDEKMQSLVKPIDEGLTRFRESLANLNKDYGALTQMVGSMKDDQIRLRNETANLVNALRKSDVRGRWGEVVLKRVLELSGLTEHVHFVLQATIDGEMGKLRPDVIVTFPRGRSIVIDSKASMLAYMEAEQCTEDAERDVCLDRHVKHIEEQIKRLVSKAYTEFVAREHGQPADFAVLFIPGESFLYAAAGRKPSLIEEAWQQRIVIATPSTLIPLLRVVAMGWREERLAESAQEISRAGAELHGRLCTFANHLDDLRKAIKKAVESYDKAVGSLDRMVVPAVKKLEELHAKSPSADWPAELTEIAVHPREIKTLPMAVGEAGREA